MNELVLSELKTDISVGTITSNAHELLEIVKQGVSKYFDENYIPNEPEAKADRAELNRLEKAIATQATAIKTAYNAPLEEFNKLVTEIRNTIKGAAETVDSAVKVYEELQKKKKRTEIDDYFATKKFELVQLDRIFDPKWLNKTKTMKEVKEELDAKIQAIYRDIEILEKINEHGTAAKAFYLEHLDMGAALKQVEVLKENAAKIAREQAERDNRKVEEQVEANARAERQERREQQKEDIVSGILDEACGLEHGTTAAEKREEIISFTCTFKGTEEQLMKLREYMTAKGIAYEKGLLLENESHARQISQKRNLNGKIYSFIYVPVA